MIKKIFSGKFNWIIIITILFLVTVGFDTFPLIRGPAPYPPEWQWTYLFINTLDRLWFPLICSSIILGLFWLFEKRSKHFEKHTLIFLLILIVLSFLFQISVQFFSRAGIAVLIHRIINPELNGYFTAALPIQNVFEFLKTYNENILNFVYHAKSHPPGAILFFYFIKQLMSAFPVLGNIANSFSPSHLDVKTVWDALQPSEKATATFSAFLIPFLSAVSIIPIYYTSKMIYGVKTAIRAAVLFVFIPSVVLFIPINDSFLHFFAISSFFLLLKGLSSPRIKSQLFFVSLSGLLLFIGVLFNLSLLPVVILLGTYFLLHKLTRSRVIPSYLLKELISGGLAFLFGFIILPLLLFLIFQFDFIRMLRIILGSVPDIHTRSYTLWLYYNIWDFFIFTGIPVAVVFIFSTIELFTYIIRRNWKKIDFVFISFFLMLLILNLSGSVRGETGRILVIFMPFLALIGSSYLTNNLKVTTNQFIIFLALQAIQIFVLQEFWVMLW